MPSSRTPRAVNPGGSTNAIRGQVLEALALLTLATPKQLHALLIPDAGSDKFIREALLDLQRSRLTASSGRSRDGRKIWHLTPAGQRAALADLPRGTVLGGTGAGAAARGAPHGLAVTDTVSAFVRGGVGTLHSWRTEVVHPLPQRRKVITDAVLQAPEAGVPTLMVELDRATMSIAEVAEKLLRYREYYLQRRRGVTPSEEYHARQYGTVHETRVWGLHHLPPAEGYPPLALVMTGDPRRIAGDDALLERARQIADGAQDAWRPTPYPGSRAHDYSDVFPLVVTTLERLTTDPAGAAGPVWRRVVHTHTDLPGTARGWQPLTTILRNDDGLPLLQQERAAAKAREDAERRQREAEREERDEKNRAWQRAAEIEKRGQRSCSRCRIRMPLAAWADSLRTPPHRGLCAECASADPAP